MRALAVLLTLYLPTVAQAFDQSQWVEVSGGAWHPDTASLAKLETALMPAVNAASMNRGAMRAWNSYTFQYQGRESLLKISYVFVNAFCGASNVDARKTWVEVFDGGTCYFSAKYDPKGGRIYDVRVNGVG